MLRQLKDLGLCLCSALLLHLSFPWASCWILAWCAFIPFFLFLEGSGRARAFFLSFLTGIFFWSLTIFWLIHVTVPGTVLLVLYLSLYFGVFGFLASFILTRPGRRTVFFLPALWVVLEYARSHLLTGFGWALLGYSQYRNLWLIQAADVTGAWGISFLVMMGNVFLYAVMRRRKCFPSVSALVIFLLALGYGAMRLYFAPALPQQERTVSVIQPNIPQEMKWDPRARAEIIRTYSRITARAALEKPDLIVWPEAAVPGIVGEDRDVFEAMRVFIRGLGAPVLLGAVFFEEADRYFNSALLLDRSAGIAQRHDKIHLVPFGEYLPLKGVFPFLEEIAPIGDITAGGDYTLFHLRQNVFGVLICFEDLFPGLARGFVLRGADFLVNITNDAWYKETPAAHQHFAASVFRAVENRRPLIRAANTGVSGVISSEGRVVATVRDRAGREIFCEGFIHGQIPGIPGRMSFYTRYGDVFAAICLLMVFARMIGMGILSFPFFQRFRKGETNG
ncbi:MAG: apolipoprotein N-acyltransferase [Candidatus Omnitrophica bacterium]|nr:apolipoprotein N-acyltransferase [Candidatus Omnitrophota bacterium]